MFYTFMLHNGKCFSLYLVCIVFERNCKSCCVCCNDTACHISAGNLLAPMDTNKVVLLLDAILSLLLGRPWLLLLAAVLLLLLSSLAAVLLLLLSLLAAVLLLLLSLAAVLLFCCVVVTVVVVGCCVVVTVVVVGCCVVVTVVVVGCCVVATVVVVGCNVVVVAVVVGTQFCSSLGQVHVRFPSHSSAQTPGGKSQTM